MKSLRRKNTLRQQILFQVLSALALVILFLIFFSLRKTITPIAPSFQNTSILSNSIYTAQNSLYKVSAGEKTTNKPQINFALNTGQNITFTFRDTLGIQKEPQKNGKSIIFKDIAPKTDLKYTTLPNGLKEEIILYEQPHNHLFRFTLNTQNAYPQKQTDTIYKGIFRDQNGRYLFHLDNAFALDAKGNRTDAITTQITKENNQYLLTLALDRTWLESKDRVYPITIDPTILHDTTSEFDAGTYNRSANSSPTTSPFIESFFKEAYLAQGANVIWHLNETSGSPQDSSGNSNTGTATGTSIVQGIMGNARSFADNTTDRLVSANNVPQQPLSYSLWVKKNGKSSADRALIQNDTDTAGQEVFAVVIGSTGVVKGYKVSNNTSTQTTLTGNRFVADNRWHHVVATLDGAKMYLYIDGVLDAFTNASNTTDLTLKPLLVGADHNSSVGYRLSCGCTIDDVSVYNRVLTEPEIVNLASRRPYSSYTSEVLDLAYVISFSPLKWDAFGLTTNDLETATASATSNIIAQWDFNDGSGTTAVSGGTCGTTCNASLTNFANTNFEDEATMSGWTYNNRRVGNSALMFEGTNDYAQISHTSSLNQNSFTLETWVFPTAVSTNKAIVTKVPISTATTERGYEFLQRSDNTFWFNIGREGTTTVRAVSDPIIKGDRYYHLVGTYDGATASLYINGYLASSSASVTTINSTANFRFGNNNSGTSPFQGIIDSTRFYDRPLTPSEVLANYNSSQIEIQTRVGDTTSPEDGTWDSWSPSIGETQINNQDNPLNVATPSAITWIGATIATKSASQKIEGSASLQIDYGTISALNDAAALYHLDETSGSGAYLKDTVSTNHLTPTGTASVNGYYKKGRSFNGSSEYLTFSSTPLTGTTYTVEGWIKTNSITTEQVIFSQRSNSDADSIMAQLYLTSAGKVAFQTRNDTAGNSALATSQTTLKTNTWYHVAGIRNGSDVYVYVNGAKEGSDNDSGGTITTNTAEIGRYTAAASNGSYFNGTIDEIRISNVVRQDEELLNSYRGALNHFLTQTNTSTDFSSTRALPFYIASSELGLIGTLALGESAFANYQPDANTALLLHQESYLYKDESSNNSQATTSYNGIEYGIQSSNLTFIVDQWNGGGNADEVDITCTGGDSACYIIDQRGVRISTPNINYGIAITDGRTGTGYIMYSPSLSGQGITPYANNSNHYIAVRYNAGAWQYENNTTWVNFTPTKDNILVAAITFVSSVTKYEIHSSLTQGVVGNARAFNGTLQHIDINSSFSLANSSFTVSFWSKRGASGAAHFVLSQGTASTNNLLHIGFRSNNQFTCAFHGNDLNTSYTYTDTDWHYWVCTYDATTNDRRIYRDGILIAQDTASADYQGTGNIQIGRYNLTSYFNGSLDEIRIDTAVKTPSEIREAYEITSRSFPIMIHFKADLASSNLIADSNDTSFTIDETPYGASSSAPNIFQGEKIIISENVDGTTYQAQATVLTVNSSTGAVTVSAYDSGSTFPTGGFTAKATVYKWQREYFDITNLMPEQKDAITHYTLRLSQGLGGTIYLDDFRQNSNYLNNPFGSSITSSINKRYFQYRAILSQNSLTASSSALTSVTLDYTKNEIPNLPSLDSPTDTQTNRSLLTPLKTTATDNDSDYLRYKITLCKDSAMTLDCQTFDQTSSQTGWSGQDTQTNTAYTSGTQATYTIQTELLPNTTYYYKSSAIDPAGRNIWSATQTTPYSFTTTQSPSTPTDLQTNGATNPTAVNLGSYINFTALHTDPDSDSATHYRVEVNTNSSFTGTIMWDSTKTAFPIAIAHNNRTSNILYAGSALSTNTTYYWRITLYDSNAAVSPVSAVATFKTNSTPNTPTLITPTDTQTGVPATVVFTTSATDPDSNYLRYLITFCKDSALTLGCEQYDQTTSQTGWSGQNTQSSTAYTSGTTATLTIQTPLTPNTTYYWVSQTIDPGGLNTWTNPQTTPFSFTISQIPDTPTLLTPATLTSNTTLLPALTTSATDPDTDSLQYEIKICENSLMTVNCQTIDQTANQAGWSATSYASGATASHTIQTALSPNTTYYWKTRAIDQNGSNTWSATQVTAFSFTTSAIPNTVTLISPSDTATEITLTPAFTMSTTDPNSDYLRYKILLCKNSLMTQDCQTFDQTSSQTGWSGQDAETNTAYASGTTATYTLSTNLDIGRNYYWQAFAIDQGGSNTWSSAPTRFAFTTITRPSLPAPCTTYQSPTNQNITVKWTDSSNEEYYQVWKSVDDGLPVQLGSNLAANTISLLDSDTPSVHKYAYLIRGLRYDNANAIYSNWCYTSATNMGLGSFQMNGVKLNGLNLN